MSTICLIIGLTVLFIFPRHSIAGKSPVKSKNKFSFYKVSEEDNINSALEKFKAIDCMLAIAKAPSLDTKYLTKQIKAKDISKKIEKIFLWDRRLNLFAKNTEIKSLPIDILHSEPPAHTFFNYWICYFSASTKKILQISISCNNYKAVKKKLIERYGKCLESNYCESKDNCLLIVKREKDYLVNMYFFENIETHYSINKEEYLKRKKKTDKKLNDAF